MALTKQDIVQVGEVVRKVVEDKIRNLPTRDELDARLENLPTRDELDARLENLPTRDEFNERVRMLPTRKEFLDAMDKLMVEVKDMRDEHTILDGRTSEHTKQIEKLEEIHPHGQHSTV